MLTATWKSPSNIALIKYWGKKDVQIPCNPSLSFTLSNSFTETTVKIALKKGSERDIQFYLGEDKKDSFLPKIKSFLDRIINICPFVEDYDFIINSQNSFPHSTGIASSASGMSALALCICDLDNKINGVSNYNNDFYNKASELSRLGSGSACRSIFPELVMWGKSKYISEGNNRYGVEIKKNIHQIFKSYQDTILIVDGSEKSVSSTIGHNLMKSNPFSEQRFIQADDNLNLLYKAMQEGDLQEFIRITELEALTLHALMMSSNPYFTLMRPNTLAIIEKIFDYREKSQCPVCFTLDAGPNIHLLYPEKHKEEVISWIKSEIAPLLENGKYIIDKVGCGSQKIN
jgi:diphosphomevalonate decarboxylase